MVKYPIGTSQHHTIAGFDADVLPVIGFGLGVTSIVLGFRPRYALVPLACTMAATLFYRDPERLPPADPMKLFAPADGKVIHIDEVYEHRFLHTDSLRISTLVSPLDVPVHRSPVAGIVRYVEHIQGTNHVLRDREGSEQNTRSYIGIETSWGPLLMAHIAGPLTQTIVNHVQEGDIVEAGHRLGTARFGSRTDLIVQRDTLDLLITSGEKTQAGMTPIAQVVPL